jgi:energy-coupling factor transporter ATP-binding protein EcfA2
VKIRALRLREVGCFSEALALEGLEGGLDVLAGPNETGKSTLFRALETLFSESYKTESQKLKEALVPYRGGAPLIEAEVEIAGRRWRYRKQFFAGRMAELVALETGEVLRNADAETRMAREIDLSGLPLVWVPQRAGLDPLPPEAAGRDLVRAAIEAEVAAMAGGRQSEQVRKAVAAELAELVSAKQQRPRNAYKAGIEQVEQLEKSLAAARARELATEGHLAALEALRREQAALASPALAAARQERLAAIERTLAADERLAGDLERAGERARHLGQQAIAAAQAHDGFARSRDEVGRLETEIAAGVMELAELAAATAAATGAAEEAARASEAARIEVSGLAARLEAAGRHAERAQLEARLAEAVRAEAAVARQQRVLASIGATEPLIARIEAEAASIAVLEAQEAAAASTIEIRLAPGGTGRIRLDGVALTSDRKIEALAPVRVDVPGIAEIRIAPAADAIGEETRADLAAHRRTLADLLSQARAPDLQSVRAGIVERRAAERACHEARATLAALAPEGVDALRRAAAAHPAQACPAETEPIAALEQALAAARALEGRTEGHAKAAGIEREAAETRHAVAAARIEERRRHRDAVAAELPAPSDRSQRLADLAEAKVQTSLAAAEAADALLDLSQRRLPSEERQQLLAERHQLRTEQDRAGQRLREIERDGARLIGLIEAQAEAGLGPEIDRLEGELAEARRRRASLEADVAGLGLLDRLLREVAAESTATYLEPVLARLGPPLRSLLGAETATVTDELGVGGIVRHGRPEASERLSTGTREQIAVLVRLAFADILAAAGRPLPVLLDDALVYADDDRLAQMVSVLQAASRRHQVLLLTCRTRAMAEAGFKPLALTPWRP